MIVSVSFLLKFTIILHEGDNYLYENKPWICEDWIENKPWICEDWTENLFLHSNIFSDESEENYITPVMSVVLRFLFEIPLFDSYVNYLIWSHIIWHV
jgi:hypothetical protein